MTNLLNIAEAILDSAAREYRDDNLASTEAVQNYADGAFNSYITKDEANQVRDVCLTWINLSADGNIPGTQDYYDVVTSKLSDA